MRNSLVLLLMLATGCASALASEPALCEATATDRTRLAAALADDAGDTAVLAGQALIARMDAGCGGLQTL